MSNDAAIKLVRSALEPKTPAARLKAAAKVIKSMSRIAYDPKLPWSAFVEQYLRDCLETKQPKKALPFLEEPRFSAQDMKKLLEPAIVVYVQLGKDKLALDWIETVRYVYGPKSLLPLVKRPELASFVKSKAYLKLAGPEAMRNIFKSDLAEVVSMWKRDEYDNYKDALFDAKSLRKDATKLGRAEVAAAQKHLDTVTKEIKKVMRDEPDLRAYLKGLV